MDARKFVRNFSGATPIGAPPSAGGGAGVGALPRTLRPAERLRMPRTRNAIESHSQPARAARGSENAPHLQCD